MPPIRYITSLLAAVLVGPALAGCLGSVPADPGLNARLRARWADTAVVADPADPGPAPSGAPHDDPGARGLYLQRCGRCHAPYAPSHASPAAWPVYVARYAPRAGLFGAERDRVLRWLQSSSR